VKLHLQREKGEHSVNAYQRKKNRAAAVLLAAVMMAAPACAAALETAPLTPCGQAAAQEEALMPAFGRSRDFKGITASREWLRQARVAGMSIDLRVHTMLGEEITFQESLGPAADHPGTIRLSIFAMNEADELLLQVSPEALEVLQRVNITEIAVANRNREMCGSYYVDELHAICGVIGLKKAELLCVSGDDDPVTVVSEDGVRRLVTQ